MASLINSSVFEFVDGTSYETFEKDEDFRSGTITATLGGKVRVEWDGEVRTDKFHFGANAYEWVDKSLLTKIDRETYVLARKS